jgi:hypothetical protein
MTINCPINAPHPVPDVPTKRFNWTPNIKSTLEALAENRAKALTAQAAMYAPIDPIVAKRKMAAMKAQQYWEQMVWETGNIAFLSEKQSARASQWIATWLGQKMVVAGKVREPLLNVKRLADGMMREMGVYVMMGKQRKFASELKAVAAKRGVQVQPEDMRRILEEGMIPQRMSVYGNSEVQEAALMDSYNKFVNDYTQRGFTQDDLRALTESASQVSSTWDELQAISQATGLNVGDIYNIGYMPRQLTDDGLAVAKLAGAIKFEDAADGVAALGASRNTWRYLPEDHNLAAKMLGIDTPTLHGLIADPVEFAMFLSKRVTEEQLDLLVDSGIMSKIPMLTNHVAEFLTRTYKLPLTPAELFITDPLAATQSLNKRLQLGAEQSAMRKLIGSEGLKKGWAVTNVMKEIDPEQFKDFVPIAGTDLYAHPIVANQYKAILDITQSPAEMNNAARAWKAYTNWFAKEAIGNPIGAKVYLFNQFLGNMLTVHGRGVSIAEYWMSVVDMTKLAMVGLEGFDNTRPFRIVDGKAITHRELVAKTARMFSRDVLPGLSGADALLKLDELDPRHFMKQLANIKASADTFPEMLGEFGKLANRKRDAILLPTIRLASILDMAGHLAVARGKTPIAGNALQVGVDAVAQLVLGFGVGKLSTWEEVVTDIKAGFPVFDDVGKIPQFLSRVMPFSAWAIQNAPLQLRDMMANPSRWVAYSRAHALWNEAQLDDDDVIARGELSQRELDEYGIILRRNKGDAATTMLMTTNFDPRWGVMTWMASLLDTNKDAEELREGVNNNSVNKWINEMMSKTYFAGVYKAASGIDAYTGVDRDDSEYNANAQFAGIAMPGWMGAALSISPILSSVDRLHAISGTRAVTDPRTGAILTPAVQGWLGNRGKISPDRLEGVEATIQTLGAKVRYIDGLANMQFTEADTIRAINDIQTRKRREQTKLATEVKNGTTPQDSPEYIRRLDAINRMTDAAIQLNYDLGRIQLWAAERKLPSSTTIAEMKRKGLVMDNLPLPGADYIKQQLDKAYKEKGLK